MKKSLAKKTKKRASKKKGLPPGSLVYVGEHNTENIEIELIEYNVETYVQKQITDIQSVQTCLTNPLVSWVNINGISDTELIGRTGKIFNLHPLLLEDILNTDHRPKVEEFEEYIFCTFKMLWQPNPKEDLQAEQISLILGKGFVISFQEKKGDIFEPIRQRIEAGKGLARSKNADYLLYMLIDIVVDHYYEIIENLGSEIEEIEENLYGNSEDNHLAIIQNLKKEITYLRKVTKPLKEMISGILNTPNTLIAENTKQYFRDVQDHLIQLIDNIETYREWNVELKDIYLSTLSNKMNQIMKVLTIISTIFIPLTFIVGVYGMNFENMPELKMQNAYFFVWLLMVVIFIAMVIFFRRKRWF